MASVIRTIFAIAVGLAAAAPALLQALGMTGISKSQVSALCLDIETHVLSFLDLRAWPWVNRKPPPSGEMAMLVSEWQSFRTPSRQPARNPHPEPRPGRQGP